MLWYLSIYNTICETESSDGTTVHLVCVLDMYVSYTFYFDEGSRKRNPALKYCNLNIKSTFLSLAKKFTSKLTYYELYMYCE